MPEAAASPAGPVTLNSAHYRIGPNAIIQIYEALGQHLGPARRAEIMRTAELGHYLHDLPDAMVDEDEVTRLQRALSALDHDSCREINRTAGRLTGDYLLANRIPHFAQACLKPLPGPLAARALLGAINRHAWTFVGSGRFSSKAERRAHAEVSISNCPLCRGQPLGDHYTCDYYSATFERLFRALVHPAATASETACEAAGNSACVFEISWRSKK